jgi:hypothetical protein
MAATLYTVALIMNYYEYSRKNHCGKGSIDFIGGIPREGK